MKIPGKKESNRSNYINFLIQQTCPKNLPLNFRIQIFKNNVPQRFAENMINVDFFPSYLNYTSPLDSRKTLTCRVLTVYNRTKGTIEVGACVVRTLYKNSHAHEEY